MMPGRPSRNSGCTWRGRGASGCCCDCALATLVGLLSAEVGRESESTAASDAPAPGFEGPCWSCGFCAGETGDGRVFSACAGHLRDIRKDINEGRILSIASQS